MSRCHKCSEGLHDFAWALVVVKGKIVQICETCLIAAGYEWKGKL